MDDSRNYDRPVEALGRRRMSSPFEFGRARRAGLGSEHDAVFGRATAMVADGFLDLVEREVLRDRLDAVAVREVDHPRND